MDSTKIACDVLKALMARKGFDDWWLQLDEELREEIELELAELVDEAMEDL